MMDELTGVNEKDVQDAIVKFYKPSLMEVHLPVNNFKRYLNKKFQLSDKTVLFNVNGVLC